MPTVVDISIPGTVSEASQNSRAVEEAPLPAHDPSFSLSPSLSLSPCPLVFPAVSLCLILHPSPSSPSLFLAVSSTSVHSVSPALPLSLSLCLSFHLSLTVSIMTNHPVFPGLRGYPGLGTFCPKTRKVPGKPVGHPALPAFPQPPSHTPVQHPTQAPSQAAGPNPSQPDSSHLASWPF